MAVDETSLPPNFRKGLRALRETSGLTCTVVAVADNFAYVDLGDQELGEHYVERSARLFARVALNFPDAVPYGLVVAPTLHRKDGIAVDRQHPQHPTAAPAASAAGLSDYSFWSWDWQGMPKARAEDMMTVDEWARKRLRQVAA